MRDYSIEPLVTINCNLINGQLVPWNNGYAHVKTPLGGSSIGMHPLTDRAGAIAALDSCHQAYALGRGTWPMTPLAARCTALLKVADAMEQKRFELAHLIIWEIAKTEADAEKEVDRTVTYIRDTVAAALELENAARLEKVGPVEALVRRAPLGVVLCMGPFNYPLNETLCTLVPALVMGNCCLVKPPRLGVLFYDILARIFADCLPPGAVNIVYGAGRTVANAILSDGRVDSLAFIGSSRTANDLLKLHPRPNRLRPILGLEAKNPAIVTASADLEKAADEIISGALSFNGQRCTAIKLVLAERSIGKQLEGLLAARIKNICQKRSGSPLVSDNLITPLAEPGKPLALETMVAEACKMGARLVAGGEVRDSLFLPALVCDVPKGCALWTDEQFGPVLPMACYDDIEEVFDYVAESQYGQQAALFSSDPAEIAALVDNLVNQVCRINVNCQCQRGPDQLPFTGRKDSAVGTLSVGDALRCFSIRTLVATSDSATAKQLHGLTSSSSVFFGGADD